MIRVEWTMDREFVQDTVRNPAIFPYVKDDTITKPEEFEMPAIDGVSVMAALCYNYAEYAGCFILFAGDEGTLDIHTCLLPSVKGMGRVFGDAIVAKIFKETDCKAITTFVPETNPLAKRLALKCGFEHTGYGDPMLIGGNVTTVSLFTLKRCSNASSSSCSNSSGI